MTTVRQLLAPIHKPIHEDANSPEYVRLQSVARMRAHNRAGHWQAYAVCRTGYCGEPLHDLAARSRP